VSRFRTAAAVLLLLSAAADGRAQNVFDFITITANGRTLPPAPGRALEVDIDSAIAINWRTPQLLAAVAQREGVIPGDSPLLVRLQLLSTAVGAFIETQEKFIALRAVSTALLAAQNANNQAEVARLTAAFRTAVQEYSAVENRGLAPIGRFRTTDPQLYAALEAAIKDDAATVRVLQDYLRRASDELAQKLTADRALQVLVSANLVDSGGRTMPLHLDGYDAIGTGDPVPFARFQLQLDDRTVREFEAAKAFVPLVTNGAARIRASIAELQTALERLPDTLKSNDLAARLEKLATDLSATGRAELLPFVNDIRQIIDAVTALRMLPALVQSGAITDPMAITQIASRLTDAIRIVDKLTNDVPARAQALAASLQAQLAQATPELQREAKDTLDLVVSTLTQGPNLKSLVDELRKIAAAVGLTGDVAQAADATSRQARDVAPGRSLDTSLDLATIIGERHPGDIVNLTATVRRGAGGDVVTIFQGRQSIRIEKYGWYSETRGALLFVQPAETLARNVSFQPAPAIGYYWRYGAKNKPGLNHELALGIGATLTLLDFDDEHDMEIGVAVGVTFLHDLFWAGAGRNLQAQKNYYYLGINPLALTGLFRR